MTATSRTSRGTSDEPKIGVVAVATADTRVADDQRAAPDEITFAAMEGGQQCEPGLPSRSELGCYALADVLNSRHQVTR